MRVLLVEDDKTTLDAMKPLIEYMCGKEVDTAADGLEALNLAHNNEYDVVITDFRMPHINGVELIERIREFNNKPLFILTTAHPQEAKNKNYKVFTKPLNTSKLKRLLKKYKGVT